MESLEKEKLKAEHEVRTANDGTLKKGNEKDAEIKKLEAALAAKANTLMGLENKLVASKAINEEGVKTKAEKQEVESSLASAKVELDSTKSELESVKKRFSEVSEEKSGLEHEQHDLQAKLEALQTEFDSATEANKDKVKELSSKQSSLLSQLANEKLASSKGEKDAIKALKLNHNKMVSEKDGAIAEGQTEIGESVRGAKRRAEKAHSPLRDVTAANFSAVSNATSTPSFATRFARRSCAQGEAEHCQV